MGNSVQLANQDQLKKLIGAIGNATRLVSDLSDGVSFSEIPKLLGLVSDAKEVISDINLTIPNWESLNDADRQELQEYAKQVVSFPQSAKVEVIVEKVLAAAIAMSAVYQALKA